jgi:hypothetical protein
VAYQRPVSPAHQLSEDAVRRVLERAVEIDALRTARITTEQLREIARDAGISAESIEQALIEFERDQDQARREPAPRSESWRWLKGVRGTMRSAVIGVGGFGLGVIARALFGATGAAVNVEQFIAIILLTFASTEFAFQHSGGGSHIGFQRDNLALWGSFTVGWSVVHGFFSSDLVSATVILWLACGIAGSSVIAWRHNRN